MSTQLHGNGKVFVSHAHQDNVACKRLVQALDSWGVDYWVDLEDIHAGTSFISTIEMELEDRDTFLYVGTPTWSEGFWPTQEREAYLNLMREDHAHGHSDRRKIIGLKMDSAFHPSPFMATKHYIDAASQPEDVWLAELKKVLGVQAGADPLKPSDLRKRYRAFFQSIMDQLGPRSEITLPKKPHDRNWCTFSTGFSGIAYGVVFPEGNKVRTELYIGGGEDNQAKVIFDHLENSRSEIEKAFGEPLSWERLNHRKASRVAAYHEGSILDDPRKLTESRNWAAQHLITFKRVFEPRLKEIIGKQ